MGQATSTTAARTGERHDFQSTNEDNALRLSAAAQRSAGRLARAIARALGPDVTVADAPVVIGPCRELIGKAGRMVAAIAIEPVHVPALMLADAALPSLLVERGFGGRIGANRTAPTRGAGLAERREFARVAGWIAAALSHGCDDRVPMVARPIGGLEGNDALNLIDADATVAAIALDIHLTPNLPAQRLSLLLPVAAFRAGTVLQASLARAEHGAAHDWRRQLTRRIADIAMPARGIIASPTLSVAQVLALRPGDVIPIPVPRAVPLLVADRCIATGTIGEREGRAAFLIETLERENAR